MLGWIFVVIGGFSTVVSTVQNIMLHWVFQNGQIAHGMEKAQHAENIPRFALFMLNHFHYFFLLFLIVSAATFVSGIGLLKRRNWARLFFVGFMSLGIVWNIGGLVLQYSMFQNMQDVVSTATPPEFARIMLVMKIGSIVIVLGVSILFGWIIKKLLSAPIKAEFS